MARMLVDLEPGTPVHAQNRRDAGELLAIFGIGESRSPGYILVRWFADGDEKLLDANEVASIDDGGASLRSNYEAYDAMPAFDPESNPMLRRLS